MSEQRDGHFYNAPPLGMAYCLAKLQLEFIQRQPVDLPHLSANTLTLLIKASAAVTI